MLLCPSVAHRRPAGIPIRIKSLRGLADLASRVVSAALAICTHGLLYENPSCFVVAFTLEDNIAARHLNDATG
jgi:hypothetical protein